MKYISVSETAKKWDINERTVRLYCNNNRIPGAFQTGKVWNIPDTAEKPKRISKQRKGKLSSILKEEKDVKKKGGIYHKIQIELTYNSNHIEGSKLTKEQTRYIYETKTVGIENEPYFIDDIIETVNHFRCVDYIIDNVNKKLTEKMIKDLHYKLKYGTTQSEKEWFALGDYKLEPNEIGDGIQTTTPEDVPQEMFDLLQWYNNLSKIEFNDIVEFHVRFEKIHPFQDGNGRVGRLIMFKECLKHNIVPFIIEDDVRLYYYRGLYNWKEEKGWLIDTCLSCQDRFKKYLDYFRIKY